MLLISRCIVTPLAELSSCHHGPTVVGIIDASNVRDIYEVGLQ